MSSRRAILIADLAYGDCGKGTIVDFLTRTHGADLVVRFNGGPQAGHNVVTPDGRHHTFSQFGSGTFVPGVRTLLSRFVLIEPYALLNEAAHLAELGATDALDRLMIDRRSVVITPAHQAANRLRELARGNAAHGTCGMGVGETMQDLLERPAMMLHAGELSDGATVARKLRAICEAKVQDLGEPLRLLRDEPRARFAMETLLDLSWIGAAVETYATVARGVSVLEESQTRAVLRDSRSMIFEGAQGVLLDEWFGFHPHTTWSTCTFANAEALLNEAQHAGERFRLGVLRTYFTRHGAGPLVTEDPSLRSHLPEPHNDASGWQGHFRVGRFDAVAVRYALRAAGGVDGLAMTHLDRLPDLPAEICTAYQADSTELPESLFVRDTDTIRDIRFFPSTDLERQELLTRALRRCRPVYRPVPNPSSEAFLSALGAELHAPIVLTSAGPRSDDKRIIESTTFALKAAL